MKLVYAILVLNFIYSISNEIPLAFKFEENGKTPRYKANCFFFNTTSWITYDFFKISRSHYQTYDYNVTLSDGTKIFYNFCKETIYTCEGNKSLVTSIFNDHSCNGIFTYFKKTWNFHENSINLTVNSNIICDGHVNHTTIFNFVCDENLIEEFHYLNKFDKYNNSNHCRKIFTIKTREACGREAYYRIWKFYVNYSFFFGCILIIFGFYIVIKGSDYKNLTCYIYCISILQLFVFSVIENILDFNDILLWFIALCVFILGIVFGYFIIKYKLRKIIISGSMGYVLMTILYFSYLGYLNLYLNIDANLYYYFLILLGCIVSILSIKKEYMSYMISSPITGSYCVIRGITLYAGGLPYESYLIDLIKYNEDETLKAEIYKLTMLTYFILWIIILTIGFYFQIYIKKSKDKINEYKKFILK